MFEFKRLAQFKSQFSSLEGDSKMMKHSPSVSPTMMSTYSGTPSLPPPSPNNFRTSEQRHSATAKRYKYLRRLLYFRQMDFEFALWQTIYLFVSPQKVYRNFQYRKQTKDQFARDDPAFLVLFSFWLCVSSIGFALVLNIHFVGFMKFLLWVIFIDCVGVGCIVATLFWFISNKYLRKHTHRHMDVEWGYAFDVHLNAFFPVLIILHVFQLFFYHILISQPWFFATFFGNTLWLIAVIYYIYITFLGYSSLPFLQNTQIMLYPMSAMFFIYLVTVLGGWNILHSIMIFYKYRVV